jgi:hypothetical protein
MKLVLVLAAMLALTVCQDPPVWPDAFEEAFDEKFIQNNITFEVNGIMYYDAANNRSRLDRFNGRYDMFCSSLVPNVTTPCTNLVVEGKRWIIFPQRSQCCFCCDSAHGCGILKPNWLEGAVYLKDDVIDGVTYHKWNKQGDVGYNYYWSSADDNNYPRRLDENGAHITEYNVHSYRKRPQDPKLFALPAYCKDPCPAATICGKLRGEQPNIRTE